jgi:hypothetical protein
MSILGKHAEDLESPSIFSPQSEQGSLNQRLQKSGKGKKSLISNELDNIRLLGYGNYAQETQPKKRNQTSRAFLPTENETISPNWPRQNNMNSQGLAIGSNDTIKKTITQQNIPEATSSAKFNIIKKRLQNQRSDHEGDSPAVKKNEDDNELGAEGEIDKDPTNSNQIEASDASGQNKLSSKL